MQNNSTYNGPPVTGLTCEFAVNPLGIATRTPRLGWIAGDGVRPTAHQVIVASTPDQILRGNGDLWDTGRVTGEAPALLTYAGKPLISGQRAYWSVRVWDGERASGYAEAAWFELALLDQADWSAEWIGFPGRRAGQALYFKTVFDIERGVARARAYVCGLGWHEFRMNGCKVGDAVLEPAQTAYNKRALYVTHDITATLQPGKNVVGVIVGSGWHATPRLIAQIDIEFSDGTRKRVTTGRQAMPERLWNITDGPIVENSIYDGEVYDARREKPDWDSATDMDPPGGADWWMSMQADGPGGVLMPQTMEPIRVIDTRRPVRLTEPRPGVFVFDGGQNLAGWAKLNVEGQAGAVVTLRFAESLYPDGTVNQENLRGARARDVYILKGGGRESWEPTFTYHGFRFVQVEGFPGTPTLDSLAIRVVRSDVEATATFSSSSEMLNRIHEAVVWTETSNLHGLPTDCPQRDERMGWLNDMAARSEELVHNFGVARFLPKWMDDIADAQDATGAISDTAPFRWGSRPADPVSVCFLMIPWLLYRHYGDTATMERHFDGMRRWTDYLTTRAPGHIVEYSHYGDWAPPIDQGVPASIGSSAIARNTPGTLVSTAHYCQSAKLLARAARVLGRAKDAETYEELSREIFAAFNRAFWDNARGVYGTGNQACNALALHMDLVPDQHRGAVLAALVADIEAHDHHLTTGNLCTKYALEVLAEEGRVDVAYRIATQTSYPSWGYMFSRGATTMWERWEESTGGGMNSHNHPMYASIGAWLHRRIGGLQLGPDAAAFSQIRIAPPLIDGLTSASTRLKTIRGLAASNWERQGDVLRLDAVVPAGARAEIVLPKATPRAKLADPVAVARESDTHIHLTVGPGVHAFAVHA